MNKLFFQNISGRHVMKQRSIFSGFTLVETLVSLVVISLIGTMIFQIIGHFTLVQTRLLSNGQMMIERNRAESWFRESIKGATPPIITGSLGFSGDQQSFGLTTIVSLTKASGHPLRIKWRIEQHQGQDALTYTEDGGETWVVLDSLPPGSSYLRFIDQNGKDHTDWPVERDTGEELTLSLVRFHSGSPEPVDRPEPIDWYVFLENKGLGWWVDE